MTNQPFYCIVLGLIAAFSCLDSTNAQLQPRTGQPQSGQTYPRGYGNQGRAFTGYRDNGPRLANSSFTYVPPTTPRKFALEDTIFVVVQESAQSTLESDVQRRKNALYNSVLQDMVVLKDLFTIKPSPQSDGDPKISGQLNQTYRAENELESREAVQFKIQATVADIRPNGHLVLEAHKYVRVNNELMLVSLSGVVDPRDVANDRSVQSERIVSLRVDRQNSGHVRDAVKRGWLTRMIDLFDAF